MINKIDNSILRLALPSIIQNITVPLLGLCDVAIMGHVGGATHLGAIAIGSMVFNVMYWLFGFLRMGTSGLTSQALGGRRLDESAALLWRSLLVGLAMGLIIIILQHPLARFAMLLMHPTADVLPLCLTYFFVAIWGAPAMLALYGLTGWFIGMQNTRTPMMIAIGQNVVNIAVSLVLVLVFDMGIKGVAMGTAIAQWVGFVAALVMLRCQYGRMLRRRHLKPSDITSQLGRFFSLNLDIFLRTLCLVGVNIYFTSAGAAQGAEVLAANTLLLQFYLLFSYVMDGFAFAGEALSGRLYGAHNISGLHATVRRLFGWGLIMVAVFTLVYWVGGTTFLRLLTTDTTVVNVATAYLPWAVLIPAAGMAAFVWDGIYIGLTRARGMLVACLIASAVFFVLWLTLHTKMANHALWLALLVYLALRGIVQTVLYRFNRRG